MTGVRQGSCSSDDIRCSSGSINSFVSQMEETEGSGGDGESRGRACDSFNMCIVTTINQGLRNGDSAHHPAESLDPKATPTPSWSKCVYFLCALLIPPMSLLTELDLITNYLNRSLYYSITQSCPGRPCRIKKIIGLVFIYALTIAFPRLPPFSMSIKACGIFSNPSVCVSLILILP